MLVTAVLPLNGASEWSAQDTLTGSDDTHQ